MYREPVLGLAPGRMRALKAIARFYNERGWTPTIRELGDVLGIGSTNAVNDHIASLEKFGAISKPREKRSRAIVITDAGWRALKGSVAQKGSQAAPVILQRPAFCARCGLEYFAVAGVDDYHGPNCTTPREDFVAR